MHQTPLVAIREVGVQPPPQPLVEALGAIDVGHGNDDDLELQIDLAGDRAGVVFSLRFGALLIVASVGLC